MEAYISEKNSADPETSETAEHTETAKTTEAAENIETAVPVQSETAEIEDKTPEETPATEAPSIDELRGKPYPLNSNTFTLLDGTKVTYNSETDAVRGEMDGKKMNYLLSEKDGRVYYSNGTDTKLF